ncbi:retrovirus-related pol polyprotein from transposon TNT 1-94 [Tanacetum coccineum]
MQQPSGFVAQGESRRVCKLKKSLYGLKQSPRAWFGKFSNAEIKCGLRRSVYDHFVFYSSSNAGCILLVVYVDDIVITGSDNVGIKKLKSFIGAAFCSLRFDSAFGLSKERLCPFQNLIAFCLKIGLHFVSRLDCVLSQDWIAFCLKIGLRFVSSLDCVLSQDLIAFYGINLGETLAEGDEGALYLGPERPHVYSDLSPEDKDRYNADIRATNILLQGLPKDIYSLINHYTDAKDIWDNVKMLLEGSELT